MNSKQRVLDMIDAHIHLYDMIYNVVRMMCRFTGYVLPETTLEDCTISIDNQDVIIEWEEFIGGCGGGIEGRSVKFPIEYLWDNQWEQKEIQKRDEAKAKAEAERKAKVDREKKQAERQQYEQYLKLQKKFGGPNNE